MGEIGKYIRLLWVASLILILDQVTKLWILRAVEPGTYIDPPPIPIVQGFYYIVHIYNTGAAWGAFAGASVWLGLLAIAVVIAIFIFRKNLGLERPVMQYSIGLLVGGIIGNLIDRLCYGHVIDFIDIHLPGYRFPAFNIADAAIFSGVAIYVLVVLLDSLRNKN